MSELQPQSRTEPRISEASSEQSSFAQTQAQIVITRISTHDTTFLVIKAEVSYTFYLLALTHQLYICESKYLLQLQVQLRYLVRYYCIFTSENQTRECLLPHTHTFEKAPFRSEI